MLLPDDGTYENSSEYMLLLSFALLFIQSCIQLVVYDERFLQHTSFRIFTPVRLPAFILLVLALFLTAQPLLVQCQEKRAEQKSCCSKSCADKKNKQKDSSKECDKTTGCNPFAGCSGCYYMVTTHARHTNFFHSLRAVQQVQLTENTVSGFVTDCWHPPEMNLC